MLCRVRQYAVYVVTCAFGLVWLMALLALPVRVEAQTPTITPVPESTFLPEETVTDTTTSTITGTVIIYALNLRAGPGTNFRRIGGVYDGDSIRVMGKIEECSWLRIRTTTGIDAWVSGDTRYVSLADECDTLPVVEADTVMTPASTPRPGISASTSVTASEEATSTVAITATVRAAIAGSPSTTPIATAAPQIRNTIALTVTEGGNGGDGSDVANDEQKGTIIPEGQGCARVLNYLGPEVTITFSEPGTGEATQIRIANNESEIICLDPGIYAVTADAPPPWDTINFEIKIEAGKGIDIPLVPQ